MLQIKTAINDEFSRELSTKTRSALLSMRKQGLYVGACPIYGYRKSDENRNQLIIDEYAASIVQDIFIMKIEGLSASAIAAKLNSHSILSPLEYKRILSLPFPQHGYADKSNAKWSVTTVFRILKDETYTGTLVQCKQYTPNYKIKKQFTRPNEDWIRIEKSHQAIISKYDFETVQRIMRTDTRTSPGMYKVNLFSGLLICGCCNGNMTLKTAIYNGKKTRYYYCHAGKINGCHSPSSIREDILITQVFEQIEIYISKVNSFLQRLAQMSIDEANRELTKDLAARFEELQKQLDQNTFFKSKLNTALINGMINENEYDYMKIEYTNKISALEDNIEKLIHEVRTIINYRDEYIKWLGDICRYASTSGFDRALIVRIVRDIYSHGKENVEVRFVLATRL